MDPTRVGKAGIRTILILLVTLVALILARQSIAFSGSIWAWTAVVAGAASLVAGVYSLICVFRNPKA